MICVCSNSQTGSEFAEDLKIVSDDYFETDLRCSIAIREHGAAVNIRSPVAVAEVPTYRAGNTFDVANLYSSTIPIS